MFHGTFKINDSNIRQRILRFINTMNPCVLMDFGVLEHSRDSGNFRAAAGSYREHVYNPEITDDLDSFINQSLIDGNGTYGLLTYDVKNLIENLHSNNTGAVNFPLYYFFVPQIEFCKKGDILTIASRSISVDEIWASLNSLKGEIKTELAYAPGKIVETDKDDYLKNVQRILEHIQQGDIYELNYCHELVMTGIKIDPVHTAIRLYKISPNPYSVYFSIDGKYLICASPEGFLKKVNNRIISSPIKGTAPRANDPEQDELLRINLLNSEKERSENVMIVDLVRNDLSKITRKGSVKVDELFGVYSFARSHQLISTISGELKDHISFFDIIKATFPMGSMTGAPKVRAMQLIEDFESFKRGIFSGSVGYIHPNGEFEFNVVIRSIGYDAETETVSVAAGGAITASSDPNDEYNETLLKRMPQLAALGVITDHDNVHETDMLNNAG